MAQYKLLETAFINQRLYVEGEICEVDDSVIPGPHMVPQDDAAKKAFKKAGITNGALPDPIEELTAV